MARMTSRHLAPQGGGFEPQRAYNFELMLYGVPGAEVIKLSILSVAPGGASNAKIELPYLNDVSKVAGQANWEDWQFVCRDFVDQPTYASLLAWKKLVTDPSTASMGRASTYKKQGHIIAFGPDGADERRQKLIGAIPMNVKGSEWAHNRGTDIHLVTVDLTVDAVIPEF